MAKQVIWLPDEVFKELNRVFPHINKIEFENYVLVSEKYNPVENKTKAEIREEFRKALSDLGHSEATVYTHWALEAYDMVHHPELKRNKTTICFMGDSDNCVEIWRNNVIVKKVFID